MRRFLLLFLLALCSSRIIYADSSSTAELSTSTITSGDDSSSTILSTSTSADNSERSSTTINNSESSTTNGESGVSSTAAFTGSSTSAEPFTGSSTSPIAPETSPNAATEGSSTPANTQPPAGSSALPVTGQPQTAKPMDLTTHIMMNDAFAPMDDKAILQQAANLNAEVLSLINEVKSLQANVDPVNSPYFAQLTQIQNNATQLNTTVGVLLQNITQANATYSSLIANYTQTIGWFNCFAGSDCVLAPTTTPGTTIIPTWAPCPTGNKVTATNTLSEYYFSSSGPLLGCSIEIDGEGGEKVVAAVKSLTFDVTGYLRFYDIPGARYLKNYTTNVDKPDNEIKTDSTQIRVEFGTGWSYSDGMSFNITYRAENPCDNYICPGSLNNSHCVLTLSGQPYCVCNDPCAMNGTDVCDTKINPCSAAAKKACKGGVDYGHCQPDYTRTDTCTFYCVCDGPNGKTDPSNNKTCISKDTTFPTTSSVYVSTLLSTVAGSSVVPPSGSSTESPALTGSTESPGTSGSTESPATPGSTESPGTSGSTENPTTPGSTENPTTPGSTENPTTPGSTENPTTPGSTESSG